MSLSRTVADLWAASTTSGVMLVGVLILRKRLRTFPIFSAYAIYCFLENFTAIWIYRHWSRDTYYNWNICCGWIDEALQLAIFYELARDVFCPTGIWARDVYRAFVGLISGSVVVALLLTRMAQPAMPSLRFSLMVRTDFFSAVLMSELLVGIAVLSITAGLPWKTHVARIAQGWGTYSLVCLAFDVVRNYIGDVSGHLYLYAVLANTRNVVWIGCELYWIVMLWRDAPEPRELPEGIRTQIYALNRRVEYDLGRVRSWRGNQG